MSEHSKSSESTSPDETTGAMIFVLVASLGAFAFAGGGTVEDHEASASALHVSPVAKKSPSAEELLADRVVSGEPESAEAKKELSMDELAAQAAEEAMQELEAEVNADKERANGEGAIGNQEGSAPANEASTSDKRSPPDSQAGSLARKPALSPGMVPRKSVMAPSSQTKKVKNQTRGIPVGPESSASAKSKSASTRKDATATGQGVSVSKQAPTEHMGN